jgi:hypothetical protein
MISSNVRSDCSVTRANIRLACRSNGETLPPRGFGAQLPLSIQRCSHRTAELGSISKLSATSRREAPAFTASITRLRKSAEYDFGIAHPPQRRINAEESLTSNPLGIPPIQIGRETL